MKNRDMLNKSAQLICVSMLIDVLIVSNAYRFFIYLLQFKLIIMINNISVSIDLVC